MQDKTQATEFTAIDLLLLKRSAVVLHEIAFAMRAKDTRVSTLQLVEAVIKAVKYIEESQQPKGEPEHDRHN